ncbi:peptide-methionine (S)-S-oxide reductase MsrA [Arsenophonus sp. aPb]|uniref:peptide-methionine (S)-S-oxide reductase MsrA n=1 Tax=Arsenophonus sp. aPb TaxID=3041619 RepID=UPI0024690947|nr:peptide-methionine (S)-S-oxide reductase MsrA [Arsenophonus sp. aPb]WGL99341.1 peptide-methionine (S)-S-oxide reductase MsrA [Arsenophonus sp. aPb]
MTIEYAVISGGCFWCTEAIFKEVIGVKSVESGYTGGTVEHPTYEQVCSGKTGHAEAIRITFDPQQVSYDELLAIHFATHDPTQLNRQGNDIGSQYRSAIFFSSEQQRQAAEIAVNDAQKNHTKPIVTTLELFKKWYPAEKYHQNYWQNEGQQNSYCLAIIPAKLQKLRSLFAKQSR